MGVKITFHYKCVDYSSFAARFLSVVKGSFAGFVSWMSFSLLDILVAGIIASIMQASDIGSIIKTTIIISAIVHLVLYGIFWLIDEDAIEQKRLKKEKASFEKEVYKKLREIETSNSNTVSKKEQILLNLFASSLLERDKQTHEFGFPESITPEELIKQLKIAGMTNIDILMCVTRSTNISDNIPRINLPDNYPENLD